MVTFFIIELDDTKILHLIAWNESLLGRDIGFKLWSQRNNSCNLCSLLSNRRRSPNLLMQLFNNFHLEHYRDTFSALNLMSLCCKASLMQSSEKSSSMRKIII